MVAENQSGTRCQQLRSDNGGEFTSNALRSWLADHGVNLQTTPPYSLESNGMAERLNRTLQDKCRTMLIAAKLTGYLWGEVLEAANVLRNFTPVSNMICTPSEKWTGQKLDLSHLRAIACKAFCQIGKGHRNGKFEPVAHRGVLVNYSLSSDC